MLELSTYFEGTVRFIFAHKEMCIGCRSWHLLPSILETDAFKEAVGFRSSLYEVSSIPADRLNPMAGASALSNSF